MNKVMEIVVETGHVHIGQQNTNEFDRNDFYPHGMAAGTRWAGLCILKLMNSCGFQA